MGRATLTIAMVASIAACTSVFDLERPRRTKVDAGSPDGEPEPDGAQPDAPMDFHVRVEAYIDGRSEIIFTGTTAHWNHYSFAAPGRSNFVNLPTKLSGVDWLPVWPDVPDSENRDCGCSSSTTTLASEIPRAPSTATVTIVSARKAPTLVQSPTAANDYTLVVELSDVGIASADWHVVDLDVVVQ